MSTLELLGLVIHQSEETHISGNILDLILTKQGSTIKVLDYRCGPYLSNHSTIECTTSIIHDNIKIKQISYPKTKNINIEIIADCDLINLNKYDLNSMVEDFNSKLLSALDANAPTVSKEVTVRHSLPWFTEEIHNQKKNVRQHEKIWKKYYLPSNWTVLKVERSKYRCMLKTVKKDAITDMVNDCGRNSKKHYTLVTNLTGTFKENPLPEGLSNKEVAEQFAKFFIKEFKKIRQELDDKETYSPGSNGNPKHTLSKLDRFMEEEVASIIIN